MMKEIFESAIESRAKELQMRVPVVRMAMMDGAAGLRKAFATQTDTGEPVRIAMCFFHFKQAIKAYLSGHRNINAGAVLSDIDRLARVDPLHMQCWPNGDFTLLGTA